MRTQEVNEQLKRIGVNFQFIGRPELRELAHILFDNEQLQHIVRGRYDGGFAILVATNQRVLLVDKKPFYLTIDDMRYEMIADVEFNHRMLDATIRLGTMNKTLRFTAYNHVKLRQMTTFIQQQVMAFRQRQDTTPIPQEPKLTLAQQFIQPVPIATDQALGQSAMQGILTAPVAASPYGGSELTVRRRVSRFY
jgi:hypothetical protein